VRGFAFRKEDLSFVARAPLVQVCEAELAAPRDAVFAAIADPATWPAWFPNVTGASYPSGPPYGVGTLREARVGGTWWLEELIAWDEDVRWAYTVTRSSVPLARAQVESFELADAAAGTRARWTLAFEPRLLLRLGVPAAPRVIGGVFRRAMRNLDAMLGSVSPR
jgi:hypothetical protein